MYTTNRKSLSVKHLLILIFTVVSVSGCSKIFDHQPSATDPVALFEEAWTAIDRNYALFGIKDVDWNTIHSEYRTKVTSEMNERELFNVLSSMLETLHDGHVVLMSDVDTAGYENFYLPYPRNFNFENIRTNYLRDDYQASGPLIYKMVDGIAYLRYGSFFDPLNRSDLDRALTDLSSSTGLIIDVRNNTGGSVQNVLTLSAPFVPARTLIKYEMIKTGPAHEDFAQPTPYYMEQSSATYKKPVILLTNRACYSACNDFVMYMRTQPQVTSFGDQTGGGGGLPANYLLANGWKLQYTSTKTLDQNNKPVEDGIQPNQRVENTYSQELNGKDTILEAAFRSLR